MALADFSVTTDDVKGRLPIVGDEIGAGTQPVSNGDVDSYIQDAESELTALLKNADLDPSDLTDDTKRQIQEAVEKKAASEVMLQLDHGGERLDDFREAWDDVRRRLEQSHDRLEGNAGQSSLEHNIDTDEDTSSGIVRHQEFLDNYEM